MLIVGTVLTIILVTTAFNNNEVSLDIDPNHSDFVIEGNFKGTNTRQLRLFYSNINHEAVTDTLIIDNSGKFKTKGKILGFSSAVIKGNTESYSVEDPNYIHIFIEPGVNKITLEENNFKAITIADNKNFELWQKLRESIDLKYQENNLRKLVSNRNKYYADHLVFPKNKKYKDSLDYFNAIINRINDEVLELKKKFIVDYSNEYISAFVLQMELQSNRIDVNDTRNYFANFPNKVQKSRHGQEILKIFQKIEKSYVGNKAVDFEAIDHKGNLLKLSDFKGKYVLLDFWAGWCKPCKKNHPELKNIYSTYNDKGLEFIGVSFDRDEAGWKQAINKENLDVWHQVLGDFRDRNENAIHNKFNVMPIPAYVLIDDKGYIVGRYLGADRFNKSKKGRNGIPELKQKLQQIFSKS